MLDSQVSEFQKHQFIEAQDSDRLKDWQSELVKLRNDEDTLKEQIKASENQIENKRLLVLNVQSDSGKTVTEKASELLQLEREIELHHAETKAFEKLLEPIKIQLPFIEENILRLTASISRKQKEQTVREAFEDFFPTQEAYLEARKKLFLVWQANGSPFGWAFPNVPIIKREGLTYQNFRGIF